MKEKSKITRRRFLALAGGTIGVTTLACCGLTILGTQQPAVKFIKSSCGGENEMSEKILVAYASRAGSTGKEALGFARLQDVLSQITLKITGSKQ